MVHQHFMLVPVFTVTENIMLGNETVRGITLDRRAAAKRILEVAEQYGLAVEPDALVEDLPVGVQQRVEIVKALYRNADILILDEPTAVLTPQEAEDMFVIMRELTRRGVSIIFITHKLKEVLSVSDRITVMRRGQVVGSTVPSATDERGLAAMMVGREVILTVPKGPANPGADVLQVENLAARDDRDLLALNGTSFTVRAGEVLGVAGVQGNGQTELVEAITGLRPVTGGRVTLCIDGKVSDITGAAPRDIILHGVGHIPEDRQKHGLVMEYPITDNLVLQTYNQPPFARGIVRDDRAVLKNAEERIAEFDVRTPSSVIATDTLSGGNKQKVIVARELSRPIKLLIAAQPTRGLDVGSIEFIHSRLIEARDAGIAVLLVSAELDEILSVSDRIAVMYKGRIVDVVSAAEATREQLGLLMAGVKP
jgi:simple sugar transport system ATP-binding protein